MQTLSIILMALMACFLLLKMYLDDRAGSCRIVSIRNIFVGGFVFFQLISAIVPLWTNDFLKLPVMEPGRAAVVHIFYSLLFLLAFFLLYRCAPLRNIAIRALPRKAYNVSVAGFISLAVVVTLLGIVLRFSVAVPYVGVVAAWVGVGLAAAGCGLAAWIWAPRVLNPVIATYASGIIFVNLLVAMWGGHGRRGMVTAIAAILWGGYFSYLRFHSKSKMILYFTPIFIGGLLFVTAYSSVRGLTRSGADTAWDKLQYVGQGDYGVDQVRKLLLGTDTGTVSLWIHENIPENHDRIMLGSLRYFFLLPVPRAIYPDKGMSLSTRVPVLAKVRGARTGVGGLGVGPGVIGHASADGGWWVAILYGCLLGWLMRILDEWLEHNIKNPFVVLALGSPLGHLFAVPRGSTEIFLMQTLVYIFGTTVVLLVVSKLLGFQQAAQFHLEGDDEHLDQSGIDDSDPFEIRRQHRLMGPTGAPDWEYPQSEMYQMYSWYGSQEER